MSLDIDEDVATKTAKEYYNTKIRLQAENFASFESYALLNNKVYERFDRMLFYLLGVRVLTSIKNSQKNQNNNIETGLHNPH